MRSWWQGPARGYVLLSLMWVLVHALPLLWLADGRHYHWEIVQAKKVLDYGFAERHGAMLSPETYVGRLANPQDYNYVHHPYPIFWFYTLLYWLFGKAGIYAFASTTALAGALLTYRVLQYFFPASVAWFSAVLFTIAHANVEFATNTDFYAQSCIVWPVATLTVIALKEAGDRRRQRCAWWLGAIIFLAGQISWLSLSVIPALMLLCLPNQLSLRKAIRRPWTVPGWAPLLAGGALSLAVFIGNVLAWSPSLSGDREYLALQMGVGSGFLSSRLSKLPVLLLRICLAGPALWLGAAVCLTRWRKSHPQQRCVTAMVLYLAIFTLIILTIPRLLFLNQNVTRFTVFPCAVLTAFALTWFTGRILRAGLATVAVASLLFCYGKLHDYRASTASVALGDWLRANTSADEFVLFNFTHLTPPVSYWDGEFVNNASMVADRVLLGAITGDDALPLRAWRFAPHLRHVSFLREASQPVEPAFLARMETNATEVLSANLPVPSEGLVVFKTARATVWKILGRHAVQYAAPASGESVATREFHLKLYRLSPEAVRRMNEELSPPASGKSAR